MAVENVEAIESWASAIPGKKYLGYSRLHYRKGWHSRWFTADGSTPLFGEVCEGLTVQEISTLNKVHQWLSDKYKNGCDDKMIADLNWMNCRVGENLYLLKTEDIFCECLIHFNTEFRNNDYPVRIYLYRNR